VSGVIFKTTDANTGNTWSKVLDQLPPQPLANAGFTDVSFLDTNNGFVTSNWGEAFSTTNGGSTWTLEPVPNPFAQGLNAVFAASVSDVWVGGRGNLNPPNNEAVLFHSFPLALVCGNGTVEAGEVCDDGNTINETQCPYGEPGGVCTLCDATCQIVLNLNGPFCGDATPDSPFEQCDDGANGNPVDLCDDSCQFDVTKPLFVSKKLTSVKPAFAKGCGGS